MNDYELNFAKTITEKLKKNTLSYAFLDPIPRDESWSNDYFAIVKEPMDLTTLSEKLENGQYANIEEWKKDVMLIWSNCKEFNDKKNVLHQCATVLEKKCLKYFTHIPRCESDITKAKIEKINAKIKELTSIDFPEYSLSARQ